jgi:hypothetical protein
VAIGRGWQWVGCVNCRGEGVDPLRLGQSRAPGVAITIGHNGTHVWPLVVIVPKHRAAFGAKAALGIAHLLWLVVFVKLDCGVVDPGCKTMSVTTLTRAASYLEIIGTIELQGDQSKRPMLPVSDPQRPQP